MGDPKETFFAIKLAKPFIKPTKPAITEVVASMISKLIEHLPLKYANALHHLRAEAGEARCRRSGACRC
jgi:hypothetical protein